MNTQAINTMFRAAELQIQNELKQLWPLESIQKWISLQLFAHKKDQLLKKKIITSWFKQ